MTTYRIKKNADYFHASNLPFRDVGLSWAAKGVLAYLLSRPNDWVVRSGDLERQYQGHGGGETAIKRIVRELKAAGYMERTRAHTPDGRFRWETHVFEVSKNSDRVYSTMGRFSTDGFTTDGKPHHILKTDLTKTDLQNRKEVEPPAAAVSTSFLNGQAAAAAADIDRIVDQAEVDISDRYMLLKAAGVGAQKMVELLNKQHTTLEYIQAHLDARGDQSMGLVITKMLDGDPAPEPVIVDNDPVPLEYRGIVQR